MRHCKVGFSFKDDSYIRQGSAKYPSYSCKGCHRAEQQYLNIVKGRGPGALEALQDRKKGDPTWWSKKVASLGSSSKEERASVIHELITEQVRELTIKKVKKVKFLNKRRSEICLVIQCACSPVVSCYIFGFGMLSTSVDCIQHFDFGLDHYFSLRLRSPLAEPMHSTTVTCLPAAHHTILERLPESWVSHFIAAGHGVRMRICDIRYSSDTCDALCVCVLIVARPSQLHDFRKVRHSPFCNSSDSTA
jgi:hypothetical protein